MKLKAIGINSKLAYKDRPELGGGGGCCALTLLLYFVFASVVARMQATRVPTTNDTRMKLNRGHSMMRMLKD